MKRALVTALMSLAVLVPAAPVSAGGDPCVFSGAPLTPGEERTIHCQIVNPNSIDATFYVFIDQSSLKVFDENDVLVTGADRDLYISFHSFSLATQRVVTASTPTDGESDDIDLLKVPSLGDPLLPSTFKTTCDEVPMTSLTGSTTNGFDGTHCYIGRVRRANAFPPGSNVRDFDMTIHFADSGDQTRFAGWFLSFSYVVRARVPAANDCSGGCFVVYER